MHLYFSQRSQIFIEEIVLHIINQWIIRLSLTLVDDIIIGKLI